MTTRLLWLIFASALLSACTPAPIKTSAVYDRIGDEVKKAAAESKNADAADKALLPPLNVAMPENVETEPRFDLSVVNAPAAQVFMALVTGTRYSMLVTPDVSGQITIRLKDVTVKEALEAIRDLYGYEYAIKGTRISIQPNTMQIRMFHVNYLASKRQGSTELRVTSSSIAGTAAGAGTTTSPSGTTVPVPTGGTGTPTSTMSNLTSRVQTTTDSDFWGGLSTALGTLVGNADGRSVVVNTQSGVIIVRALPSEIRAVENYLKATQAIVDRQVMLEAKVVDVTLSQGNQSGVNWAAFGGAANRGAVGVSGPNTNLYATSNSGTSQGLGGTNTSTVTPGQFGSVVASALGNGFFGLAFQTANFAALLNFLESQGTVSVLSSPRIATINNQKAVLKVGTDDLFITNVTTTTTATTSGSVSTPSLTLQPYFSGIALDVTPQIDEDNNIILHIHPAVSVVTEKTTQIDLGQALGQFSLPLASSSVNETDSIVRARDGYIIAIGGLMHQDQTTSVSQLPGASNAGAVGALAGQRNNTINKRELIILLKPTVINDNSAWTKDIEEASERLSILDPRQFKTDEK
jgi:MSHA biogenesis protein MshL